MCIETCRFFQIVLFSYLSLLILSNPHWDDRRYVKNRVTLYESRSLDTVDDLVIEEQTKHFRISELFSHII